MKMELIALAAAFTVTSVVLHAQKDLPSGTHAQVIPTETSRPEVRSKIETRELLIRELRDIRFEAPNGIIKFRSGASTYWYASADRVAATLLLAELRQAEKVEVVGVPDDQNRFAVSKIALLYERLQQ